MSQGKSKTMLMEMFLGVEAVYYGIVQVENDNSFAILSFCFFSPCLNYKYVNQDANVEFKDSLGRLEIN